MNRRFSEPDALCPDFRLTTAIMKLPHQFAGAGDEFSGGRRGSNAQGLRGTVVTAPSRAGCAGNRIRKHAI
jgi:hypothetical protein